MSDESEPESAIVRELRAEVDRLRAENASLTASFVRLARATKAIEFEDEMLRELIAAPLESGAAFH